MIKFNREHNIINKNGTARLSEHVIKKFPFTTIEMSSANNKCYLTDFTVVMQIIII